MNTQFSQKLWKLTQLLDLKLGKTYKFSELDFLTIHLKFKSAWIMCPVMLKAQP